MFTVFEHTADLGVRVEAASLTELYADAAAGLFAVIAGDLEQVRPVVSETFTVPGSDPTWLLFDFLGELHAAFELRRMLFREVAVIPRVSLPSALGGILVGLGTWLAQVVFAQQPGGYPDLGVFSAALQWRMVILFLPTALGNVLLPLVASQQDEGSRRFQVFNQLMAWALVSVTAMPLMAFQNHK